VAGNIVLVIPAYNAADTIECTLRSIQAQGEALCRLTAVCLADNCSQDATLAVAQAAWSGPIPLWVLRSDRNVGQHNNVNRAFCALRAQAEWILLLHADDEAKPGWLSTMLREIESSSPEVASICCSWDSWFPNGHVLPGEDDPDRPTQVIVGGPESVRGTLLKGCWWLITGCAIRVATFEDVGTFDQELMQVGDWDWLLRCLGRGWSVKYVPRTLIRYRQHPSSISTASLQMDRDVAESLRVVRGYTSVLSRGDLLRFHIKRAGYLTRRMLHAAVRLRVRRLLAAARMFARSGQSLLRCLAEAGHPRPETPAGQLHRA
jgi:glycosyltransferase involved in cell wall biosynthesis